MGLLQGFVDMLVDTCALPFQRLQEIAAYFHRLHMSIQVLIITDIPERVKYASNYQ